MLVDEAQAVPFALSQELNRVHQVLDTHGEACFSKRRLSPRVYFNACRLHSRRFRGGV